MLDFTRFIDTTLDHWEESGLMREIQERFTLVELLCDIRLYRKGNEVTNSRAWDTRAAIDLLVSRVCIATVVGRRTLFGAIRCLQGRKSRGE
ncbi:hypothetical protein LCGC14_1924090 [marine sediment metagenome]|uniref:Uncharacterized protein n=1 Tax=marine sediment metagenome TaxID=412755 RepID=A0A0F9IMP5_9ZZZZ